jgi:glycosyltransferase involved in cell wall biosynthesis
VRGARKEISRIKPDLVHLNSSTLAAAAQAATLERVPVVWHIREPIARGYVGLRRSWLRHRIARDATRVIAISAFDAGRLRPSPRVRVVANFVDWTRFDRRLSRAEARAALELADGERVVTMLGGVSRAKGTLTFVEAAARIAKPEGDVTFLVAGPPPRHRAPGTSETLARVLLGIGGYDAQVTAAAARVARGRHRFLGVRSDVPRLLAATDILVFPAAVPHFGRPLIEAAAMAIPAIASRLGPAGELVVDGVTGRLVPPEDADALASAIVDLLADPDAGRRMGEAAYARARGLFDARSNARRTFAVYDEILT